MSSIQIPVFFPTKPSSNDESWSRLSFGAETSLPITQSSLALSHDTNKLWKFVIILWKCHIHVHVVLALFCIFFPFIWWGKSKISLVCRGCIGNEISASNLHRKYICYPYISNSLFSGFYVMRVVSIFVLNDCYFDNKNFSEINGSIGIISMRNVSQCSLIS